MQGTGTRNRGLGPLALAVAACAVLGCAREAPEAAPEAATHDTVVALERDFAAASRERGAKAAFLAFLGEESIVLQPGPVWGRAAWTAGEDLPGTLDWQPDRAQMSAGGDLGFTTGPWRFTPREAGRGPVEGRYLTVWRRPGGEWRVLFDGGFGRAPAGAWEARGEPALAPFDCEPGEAVPPGELQLLDLAMSGVAGGDAHAARLQERLARGAWLFHGPSVEGAGDETARAAALSALPAGLQYWPMGAGMAGSGDLGYSYGLSAPAADAGADAAYVHLWCRQDGAWRLALQLRSPLPAG